MARLFADKLRDARARSGMAGVAAHWISALADAVRNGWAERRAEATRRRDGSAVNGSGDSATRGTNDLGRDDRRRRGGGMDSLRKDVQHAVRTLMKNPGFTLVALITIGLGIGANTAIFSVVRAVLLRPLPYDEPEELVILWGEMRTRDVTHFPSSPPDFRDYREQADLLEDLAAAFAFQASLTGDGEPTQVNVGFVTPGFLSMLGVDPVLGRLFIEEDGTPDPEGVQPGQPGSQPGRVVLSHALWQQRYAGDPRVVGRTIELGGATSEVVGVMPSGFEVLMPPTASFPSHLDLWVAARLNYDTAPRNNVFLIPVGRLRDGATPQQLQGQIDRISEALATDDQVKTSAGYGMRVERLHEDLTAEVRPVLLALLGAVVFVLLIACANVSNLLLVRASGRHREFAVRAALGGSRARLIRQLMLESGLLALAGAVIGLAVAAGGIRLLLALQPDDLPRIDSVRIDAMVLGFTLLASAAAALAFGVLPAVQATRFELVDSLKERGQASATAARRLLRNGVVVVEVALSLVLLIGAGLMFRSFVALNRVDPGYQAEGVLTFTATPPNPRYPTIAEQVAFKTELQRRLAALPGVEDVGLVYALPLAGQPPFNGRYGPEEALTDPGAFRQATYRTVLPGYFEAMDTRLIEGRLFTLADNADSTSVVVVDEKLAASMWPDEAAVGKRFLIRVVSPEPDFVEVIGVVEHQRSESLAADGMETIYFTDKFVGSFGGARWVVEAGVDPLGLVGAIRSELEALDPDVPLANVELMTTYVDRAMGSTRFALTLIGVFGAVALVLASVGLYGVLSYLVRQRTAEIGVRMAFGAERGTILKLVVGQGVTLTGAGLALGLLLAWSMSGALGTLLVGVAPTDPLTFASTSLLFLAVAALACYLPARRATHVDPVTALREE
jgi:putative ABC transport system permease protein